jgi:predicted ATPase/class 3 adenylate cyclase
LREKRGDVSTSPEEPRAFGSAPTGTVTFAFTDIEGSTQRWERNAVAMQAALRRHDELLRATISEHRGFVFKTIGDAFCAAFGRPQDGVSAMLAAQRALAAEDFSAVDGVRVRAALHTGTAHERDGDYFGPVVNRVARLLATGHGGQVLASGITADLVRGALPPQTTLVDLGEHRLKDLAKPECVYQLLAPDLPSEFPPLRSLNVLANNLPSQLTTLVGREREVGEIEVLVAKHRLVTLVGAGGIGKTRASLQVAANLLEDFPGGAWFVELAPLSSGEYVPTAIAHELDLAPAADGDALASLVATLQAKPSLLLVLDNCEHLIEAVAGTISAIVRACPNVRVLASSRQSLGVGGEATYQMPTLSLPSKAKSGRFTAGDVIDCAAVALFCERAGAANAAFALSDENAPDVAEICRRLDGIPLAIELAAARANVLSPKQLRERLDARFRLLTGGSRDALPRQQTLRALIDWSHELLEERERVLFRRLAIFINGFTIEGAVAAGGGDGLDELDVFDLLASLIGKSLVLAEPEGDALRYRLLESTRVYALEKLVEAGEHDVLAGRRLRYLRDRFVALRARVEETGRQAELSDALRAEREDVRSALDGAQTPADVVAGGVLLTAIELERSWTGANVMESIARCERYLAALPREETRLLARISTELANFLGLTLQKARAIEVATEAVALARVCGEGATLARALEYYAFRLMAVNRLEECEAALAEAESIAGISPRLRLQILAAHANLSASRGDLDTAARTFELLRDQHRTLGSERALQVETLNLAEIEHQRGRTKRSIALVEEIMTSIRSNNESNLAATTLQNLAGYLAAENDLPGAIAAAREAIVLFAASQPEHVHVVIALEHLALAYALGGDLARAATLEGYVENAFRRLEFVREYTEEATHVRLTELLREGLAPSEFDAFIAAGAALTPAEAIARGLD